MRNRCATRFLYHVSTKKVRSLRVTNRSRSGVVRLPILNPTCVHHALFFCCRPHFVSRGIQRPFEDPPTANDFESYESPRKSANPADLGPPETLRSYCHTSSSFPSFFNPLSLPQHILPCFNSSSDITSLRYPCDTRHPLSIPPSLRPSDFRTFNEYSFVAADGRNFLFYIHSFGIHRAIYLILNFYVARTALQSTQAASFQVPSTLWQDPR